jgi:hypothetical protein
VYSSNNFLHLTPFIPLSLKERGRNKKEGDGVNVVEKRNLN